jgi:hypothetical protein
MSLLISPFSLPPPLSLSLSLNFTPNLCMLSLSWFGSSTKQERKEDRKVVSSLSLFLSFFFSISLSLGFPSTEKKKEKEKEKEKRKKEKKKKKKKGKRYLVFK